MLFHLFMYTTSSQLCEILISLSHAVAEVIWVKSLLKSCTLIRLTLGMKDGMDHCCLGLFAFYL